MGSLHGFSMSPLSLRLGAYNFLSPILLCIALRVPFAHVQAMFLRSVKFLTHQTHFVTLPAQVV